MYVKKGFFSFTMKSLWQRSRFAQSDRSSLQFSGLLIVIISGTQSLQASKDDDHDDHENTVCRE